MDKNERYRAAQYKAYEALETDEGQERYFGLRLFLAVLIVLNLISVALNTVPRIVDRYAFQLAAFEIFAVTIITIELAVRLWACTVDPKYSHPVLGRLRFLIRPITIVDVLSIAPSYVSLFALDLRFLRTFRLVRLLRVLKIGRYSEGLDRLDDVIKRKRGELVSSFLLIVILLTLVSGLMYLAEHDAQPQVFETLPDAIWWSTLMMTGEFTVTPITLLGRVLGMLIAMLGVGLFALPAGIIASGFLEQLNDRPAYDDEDDGRV
jgi:voltage-gated potassium channel